MAFRCLVRDLSPGDQFRIVGEKGNTTYTLLSKTPLPDHILSDPANPHTLMVRMEYEAGGQRFTKDYWIARYVNAVSKLK